MHQLKFHFNRSKDFINEPVHCFFMNRIVNFACYFDKSDQEL